MKINGNGTIANICNEILYHYELTQLKDSNNFIVQCYGYTYDYSNIYIILEYCENHTLLENLPDIYTEGISSNKFHDITSNTSHKLNILKQIALCIKFLHDNNIAWRDCKMENIVKCGDKYKLIDFGLSDKKKQGQLYNVKGTAIMFSEHVYNLWKQNDRREVLTFDEAKAADIYAFGLLIVLFFWEILNSSLRHYYRDILTENDFFKPGRKVLKYDNAIDIDISVAIMELNTLTYSKQIDDVITGINRTISLNIKMSSMYKTVD